MKKFINLTMALDGNRLNVSVGQIAAICEIKSTVGYTEYQGSLLFLNNNPFQFSVKESPDQIFFKMRQDYIGG